MQDKDNNIDRVTNTVADNSLYQEKLQYAVSYRYPDTHYPDTVQCGYAVAVPAGIELL